MPDLDLIVVALQFSSLLQPVLEGLFFSLRGMFNFKFTSQVVIFTLIHFLLKSMGRKGWLFEKTDEYNSAMKQWLLENGDALKEWRDPTSLSG